MKKISTDNKIEKITQHKKSEHAFLFRLPGGAGRF